MIFIHFKQGARAILPALFLLTATCSQMADAQCPAVNKDSRCGTVITVVDGGYSISATGQGPYGNGNDLTDFVADDTLVGVTNNSSQPVSSIGLASTRTIFAFAGDGIDQYGVPGNGFDNTTYGGPNAYFTNISQDQTSGTVNFVTAIPPGGTSYFSLAASLSVGGDVCSAIISNAVTMPSSGGTDVRAFFTPHQGYSLADAAQICGFTNFNWQQLITNLPNPSPYYDNNFNNLSAPSPFNDPPPAGYSYQYPNYNAVGLPIYYNLYGNASDLLSLAHNETAATLSFYDSPADPCLPGGNPGYCGYLAPDGSYLAFSTHLVGIIGTPPNATVQDTGIGFSYTDTFNGTSGGIAVLNATHPVDPGSGIGSIIITNTNNVSTYTYPHNLTIKTVNGKTASQQTPLTLLLNKQIATLVTPLLYIRQTNSYDGLVIIENKGKQAIQGPFQMVLLSLTPGIILANETGVFANNPYITLPWISKLQPGEFAFVFVQFKSSSDKVKCPPDKVKFSPALYTGGFN